jgi:Lon protease-like protein
MKSRRSGHYGSSVGDTREIIPVFPLTHVLIPAMPLPLHIFEDRYRQLLADVLGDGSAQTHSSGFGVLALRTGSEVAVPGASAQRPDLAQVGTFAEILEVEALDDGTSRLLAVGSRRFEVHELLDEGTPYLRAEVSWLDELDGEMSPSTVGVTRHLCITFARLITALTGTETEEPPQDPAMLSYHVAGQLPLVPGDRQALLAAPTAADRLRMGIGLLRREIRLVQSTRSIAMAPSVLRMAAEHN